ncbi:MAG: patatin-like phospholipase family protein [Bacteroidia bacterium]|nr:patatin-like phospholipase family protein [Bacteroidia bacterium]
MKTQTTRITHNLILAATFLVVCIFFISCSKKFMVITEPATLPPPRGLETPPRVALVLGGGALYADYPHIDSLVPLVLTTTEKDVFDFSLFRSRMGFVSGKRLQAYLSKHLHHVNIEEMEIPFVAVTTDLLHAKTVALAAGPIAPSVNASCAIPYIFEPVKMYGTIFVDGGTLDNVATDIAKGYNPQVIIAIDIMADFNTASKLNNKEDVRTSAGYAASRVLKEMRIPLADIWIAPDLTGMSLMSSKDNEQLYKAGIEAGKKALPQIRELLIKKGIL